MASPAEALTSSLETIPARFVGVAPLRRLTALSEQQEAARAELGEWAALWAEPEPAPNLFLLGSPGSGKTHAAISVALEVCLAHGIEFVFLPLRSLLSAERVRMDGEQAGGPSPATAAATPLLVLDDLGRERITEWSGDLLDRVLGERYDECRPTIFTSNYRIGKVGDNGQLEADPQSLAGRIGLRITDRIRQGARIVALSGATLRPEADDSAAMNTAALMFDLLRSHLGRPGSQQRGLPAAFRSELCPTMAPHEAIAAVGQWLAGNEHWPTVADLAAVHRADSGADLTPRDRADRWLAECWATYGTASRCEWWPRRGKVHECASEVIARKGGWEAFRAQGGAHVPEKVRVDFLGAFTALWEASYAR